MARWFRVIDTSRHCGLPIVLACIALGIITAACQAYSLYFLPIGAAVPLMITAGAVGLVGIIAALTGFRILTILYIIGGTLIQIPVFVVIGFVSYTLASYNEYSGCVPCRYRVNYYYCSQSDYVSWLCGLDEGLLWSAISVAFVACLFVGTTLQSYRKLRLHQAGVGTVVAAGGHHHHHHHVEVVQQPATVYTVPAATVVSAPQQPTVFVQQQNPGMYPVIPPPAYTANTGVTTTVYQVGQVQPINYNPPCNPDF